MRSVGLVQFRICAVATRANFVLVRIGAGSHSYMFGFALIRIRTGFRIPCCFGLELIRVRSGSDLDSFRFGLVRIRTSSSLDHGSILRSKVIFELYFQQLHSGAVMWGTYASYTKSPPIISKFKAGLCAAGGAGSPRTHAWKYGG